MLNFNSVISTVIYIPNKHENVMLIDRYCSELRNCISGLLIQLLNVASAVHYCFILVCNIVYKRINDRSIMEIPI